MTQRSIIEMLNDIATDPTEPEPVRSSVTRALDSRFEPAQSPVRVVREVVDWETRDATAERNLERLSPSSTDDEIVEAIAEYYISKRWMMHGKRVRLSVLCESAPPQSTFKYSKHNPKLHTALIEQLETHNRQISIINRIGFDWQRKNVFGITTDDEARAREWITSFMLAGFAVFYSFRQYGGGSKGTIAHWRERQAERRKEGKS